MAEMRRNNGPAVQQIDISRRAAARTTQGERPVRGTRPAGQANYYTDRADEDRMRQGRPSQGRAPQGRAPQGRPPQGRTPQGRVPQGRPPQGRAPQGRVPQGRPPQDRMPQDRVPVRNRRTRRRRSRGGSGFVTLLLLLILVIVVGIYLHGRVETTYVLEAGESVAVEKLVVRGKSVLTILEDLTEEEMHTPGEYDMKVKLFPFTYTVKVTVQDTIPPKASSVSAFCKYGQELKTEAFITDVVDATDVTYAFEKAPDYTQPGEQEVVVVYTDEGGNRTSVVSTLYISNLMSELTVEAGAPKPEPRDFLEDIAGFENTEVYYITDPGEISTNVLGETAISILVDGRESLVYLVVQDTIAPQFTVQHINGWTLKPLSPEDFVVSGKDATTITYSFASEPDWTKAGSGSVEIIARDEAGNTFSQIASYKLKEDKVAPEVSLSTIDIIIGEAVSYKKAVGYSDNADSKEELKLEIDNSKVDPNTVGTYKVTYTVTDTAGNSTTKTGEVYVLAEKPVYYDEDVVNQKADEVLAQIIKDNMTLLEKTRAIYNWVHGKIGYISHSEKTDWVRGAYEGLVKRQGDCFVYACTAKVLLTRAGIENMDIVKSQVNPSHYWNLVNLGEGWYHFDATPRKDKTVFFMWTDAQLKEYSESHKNTHIYDASLYPEIN